MTDEIKHLGFTKREVLVKDFAAALLSNIHFMEANILFRDGFIMSELMFAAERAADEYLKRMERSDDDEVPNVLK